MQYIYALSTEVFKSEQDYFDASPTTQYFYVGRTGNIERRKKDHASKAKNGSTYPYHKKIAELGDNWEIECLEEVEDKYISDYEEFYIIKLTSEGHTLLNIKRGDSIRNKAKTIAKKLSDFGIKSAKDYSKVAMNNREEKIRNRERRNIKKSLIHLGLDESGKKRRYSLHDEIIVAERYVPKDEIVEQYLPSKKVVMDELLRKLLDQAKELMRDHDK